jgi:predicted nucleic acid-binding protein
LKNDASEISTYLFRPEDELLLDTNIWFSIYGPAKPGDWRTRVYSKALSKMLAASSRICLDVLILSEYINRYAHLKHNILKVRPGIDPDFKRFRKSPDFKPVASDIAGDVRQILKHCERIESDLPAIDIDALIGEYGKGDSDFNDQVLAELCKRRNLKLVTHDGDFKDRGLTILTANKALLV